MIYMNKHKVVKRTLDQGSETHILALCLPLCDFIHIISHLWTQFYHEGLEFQESYLLRQS